MALPAKAEQVSSVFKTLLATLLPHRRVTGYGGAALKDAFDEAGRTVRPHDIVVGMPPFSSDLVAGGLFPQQRGNDGFRLYAPTRLRYQDRENKSRLPQSDWMTIDAQGSLADLSIAMKVYDCCARGVLLTKGTLDHLPAFFRLVRCHACIHYWEN